MTTASNTSKSLEPIINDPSVAKLLEALNRHDAQPNVLTVDQLLRFMPVLSPVEAQKFLRTYPGKLGLELLDQLRKEFCEATPRLYAPTVVVTSTSDRTVVYEFPQRLTEVKSITPTIDAMLVSGANTNAVQHDPDSVHAEKTLNTLLSMMAASQLDPDHIKHVAAARHRSEEIVRRMDAVQGRTPTNTVSAPTGPSIMTAVEFDLD